MAFKNSHLGLLASALAFAGRLVIAQNPGTTPEVHPSLPTWKCTTSGGCVQQNTSVVIDWDFRAVQTSSGQSCLAAGGVSATLCPDEKTCSQNCVVEGVNYTSVGVTTSGSSLTMSQYVNSNGKVSNASPRLYLLGPDGNYVSLQLLNQELTFDVDLSTLPCGENGALYLSSMDITGGRNQYQTGGANYGAGYCDAQSPVANWRNGTLNTARAGYPCDEMDIMEANSQANAFTPHPCKDGTCDRDGCGFNPYGQGFKTYYGAGKTLDTSKPFTVTTQFVAVNGSLDHIVRKYQQGGKAVPSAAANGDIITAAGCKSAALAGGLAEMGTALGAGMVLIFSIWNDNGQDMNWLDSGTSGPCNSTEGNPAIIEAQHPDTHVVWSNIRWGDIGSTGNTPS